MNEYDAVARTEVQPGWEVFDADDEPIGVVEDVHESSFSIRPHVPMSPHFDVSFSDIESADDGRVELLVTGDELRPE